MKSLNSFLELYKPKSPDEQKFVDKHVVKTRGDANGNGDDVFKGAKVKKVERTKERKGYEPGDDEKVYEEVEDLEERNKENATKRKMMDASRGARFKAQGNYTPDPEPEHKTAQAHNKAVGRSIRQMSNEEVEELDELSQDKLMQYRSAAKKQGTGIQDKMKVGGGDWSKDGKDTGTLKKRMAGYKMAGRKVNPGLAATAGQAPRVAATEETELEEKMNMKTADMGDVITDFQKSDAPQFKGKTKAQRRVMAIAAKLQADRGDKPMKEETVLSVEEILESRIEGLNERDQRVMLSVFAKLTEENQEKFLDACETEDGVNAMLDFSIKHRNVE